jgi:acyl carrier protein
MSTSKTVEKLVVIVAKQLGKPVGEISPGMSLTNDLSMDSVQIMSLLTAIDSKMNKTIAYDKYEEIDTIQDVADNLINSTDI